MGVLRAGTSTPTLASGSARLRTGSAPTNVAERREMQTPLRATTSCGRLPGGPATLRYTTSGLRLQARPKTSLPPLTALPLNRTTHNLPTTGTDRLPPRPLGPQRVASVGPRVNLQPLQ